MCVRKINVSNWDREKKFVYEIYIDMLYHTTLMLNNTAR